MNCGNNNLRRLLLFKCGALVRIKIGYNKLLLIIILISTSEHTSPISHLIFFKCAFNQVTYHSLSYNKHSVKNLSLFSQAS